MTDVPTVPWTHGSKISEQLLVDELATARPFVSGRLLDLGCGAMPYRTLLGSHAKHWVGVDRAVRAGAPDRLDALADVFRLPFRDASFDCVLCTQVLEHVARPPALFEEARRVLRPGGRLILSAPQYNPLHEEPHDYFRYTRYGLSALAGDAGFEVAVLRQLGGAPAVVGQAVVWHLNWVRRLPLLGIGLSAGLNAAIAWAALRADAPLRRWGAGAVSDTLGWLLVARRSM